MTTTHEGGKAVILNAPKQLERATMACMLWEDTFYESGVNIAERIQTLADACPVEVVADIALRTRKDMNIRHAPLWLVNALLPRAKECQKVGVSLSDLIYTLCTRPDDMTELLSMYWKAKRVPLSSQLKKGLALTFPRFDEYQLAKYNRKEKVSLKDVLFLSHAKPKDLAQEDLFKRLINDELQIPDTWEVNISNCHTNEEKKAAWLGMLERKTLGALALLRNLRNMLQSGVSFATLAKVINEREKWDLINPFQFVTAVREAPSLAVPLSNAMLKVARNMPKLSGSTLVLLDTSGSMDTPLSQKGTVTRTDVASSLGMIAREVCEHSDIVMFGTSSRVIPAILSGMAMRGFIETARGDVGYGTNTGAAVKRHFNNHDRLIIVTDEQAHDTVPRTNALNYIINVGSYAPSIAYNTNTVSLTGWSNNILKYIQKNEA